jgi:hypothetical protein
MNDSRLSGYRAAAGGAGACRAAIAMIAGDDRTVAQIPHTKIPNVTWEVRTDG